MLYPLDPKSNKQVIKRSYIKNKLCSDQPRNYETPRKYKKINNRGQGGHLQREAEKLRQERGQPLLVHRGDQHLPMSLRDRGREAVRCGGAVVVGGWRETENMEIRRRGCGVRGVRDRGSALRHQVRGVRQWWG